MFRRIIARNRAALENQLLWFHVNILTLANRFVFFLEEKTWNRYDIWTSWMKHIIALAWVSFPVAFYIPSEKSYAIYSRYFFPIEFHAACFCFFFLLHLMNARHCHAVVIKERVGFSKRTTITFVSLYFQLLVYDGILRRTSILTFFSSQPFCKKKIRDILNKCLFVLTNWHRDIAT